MIGNFNKNNDSGIKIVAAIMFIVIFVVWLLTPPSDKISQVCSWVNNVCLNYAKMTNSSKAYIYERNQIVLQAKMNPKDDGVTAKMDKLINANQNKISKSELADLHRDRAEIKLYKGQFEPALQDFLYQDSLRYTDYLKIALIYNLLGDKEQALSYCNTAVNREPKSIIGFACFSKIYEDMGNYEAAKNLWELAVDRNKSNAEMWVELGRIKKVLGDSNGANTDFAKAQTIKQNVKLNSTLIHDTIYPKKLDLQLKF